MVRLNDGVARVEIEVFRKKGVNRCTLFLLRTMLVGGTCDDVLSSPTRPLHPFAEVPRLVETCRTDHRIYWTRSRPSFPSFLKLLSVVITL